MKNIDDMSAVEICEYLNTDEHSLPIIMKHGSGYDVYWRTGLGSGRRCKSEHNLTFREAIRIFKKFVLHAISETNSQVKKDGEAALGNHHLETRSTKEEDKSKEQMTEVADNQPDTDTNDASVAKEEQ